MQTVQYALETSVLAYVGMKSSKWQQRRVLAGKSKGQFWPSPIMNMHL